VSPKPARAGRDLPLPRRPGRRRRNGKRRWWWGWRIGSDHAGRHLRGRRFASQVERNWAFSPQLAGGDKNLKVGLVFKVLPNGEIPIFVLPNDPNNSYLDESAYKAIVKSSPVAPHPPAIKEGFVVVAIRFTPEGIR